MNSGRGAIMVMRAAASSLRRLRAAVRAPKPAPMMLMFLAIAFSVALRAAASLRAGILPPVPVPGVMSGLRNAIELRSGPATDPRKVGAGDTAIAIAGSAQRLSARPSCRPP
jgi:hypothetical protein